MEAKHLIKLYGEQSESPVFPLSRWLAAVASGTCRHGYWEWVAAKLDLHGCYFNTWQGEVQKGDTAESFWDWVASLVGDTLTKDQPVPVGSLVTSPESESRRTATVTIADRFWAIQAEAMFDRSKIVYYRQARLWFEDVDQAARYPSKELVETTIKELSVAIDVNEPELRPVFVRVLQHVSTYGLPWRLYLVTSSPEE